MSKKGDTTELTDDIEVIGPGQMLADARQSAGYTQEDVAQKLNFRTSLVADIENEIFDKSLPDTYNRGYLRNYAKLVKISEEDVLNSYEMLGIAKTQGAEMQSFSRATEKQAHNNYLMWATYLIIALVVGSSAMWWLQGNQGNLSFSGLTEANTEAEGRSALASNQAEQEPTAQLTGNTTDSANSQVDSESLPQATAEEVQSNDNSNAELKSTQPESGIDDSGIADLGLADSNATDASQANSSLSGETAASDSISPSQPELAVTEVELSTAIFNFSGDCWVNIYDATGERVAWGVKKSGYEMTISGVAPLTITLGKPELVSVRFNGESVDMSQFNQGNIAKFSLPLE